MQALGIGPALDKQADILLILLLELVPAESKNPVKKAMLVNNKHKIGKKKKLYLMQNYHSKIRIRYHEPRHLK